MNGSTEPPRVLSIQSHTVTGYVGNRCAIFTLQLLGLEADAINSVQFSNHGGYPVVKGSRLDGGELTELADGLEANGLLRYDFLLTGYIATVSMLQTVAELVRRLRQHNPDVQYVCDPCMGDNGKMFVAKELLPVYRDTIVPLAAVLTPNCYEAELLTGLSISSTADALAACRHLHDRGPATVVITSMAEAAAAGEVVIVASTTLPQAEGLPQRFLVAVPRLDIPHFAGPGDLMTALLLGWSQRLPGRLQEAVVHAAAALQAVLRATAAAAGPAADASQERSAEVVRRRELRLVESQAHIARPPVVDGSIRVEALP